MVACQAPGKKNYGKKTRCFDATWVEVRAVVHLSFTEGGKYCLGHGRHCAGIHLSFSGFLCLILHWGMI